MATPSAVKLSMPTTMATTKAATLSGKWTLNPSRPDGQQDDHLDCGDDHGAEEDGGSSAQVGSGLSRSRLSRPISRRLTRVMAKMLKQAAMTP